MAKEARKKDEAVQKVEKAVRKAVRKGVSQSLIESTVDAAIVKAARKGSAKKSAALDISDPDVKPTASQLPAAKLKKLPGKRKPPTLTLKKDRKA